MNLHPQGESLPEGGVPDWIAQLLQYHHEYAGPDRRAMDFASGPVVVAHYQ